jgi:hypothetical protein
VPGCAAKPEAIIDGVALGLQRLKEKREGKIPVVPRTSTPARARMSWRRRWDDRGEATTTEAPQPLDLDNIEYIKVEELLPSAQALYDQGYRFVCATCSDTAAPSR